MHSIIILFQNDLKILSLVIEIVEQYFHITTYPLENTILGSVISRMLLLKQILILLQILQVIIGTPAFYKQVR